MTGASLLSMKLMNTMNPNTIKATARAFSQTTKLPIGKKNKDDLVRAIRGELLEASLPSKVRGFAIQKGKTILIVVNINQSEAEKRVVIAHEIGHVVLGHARTHKVTFCGRLKKDGSHKDATIFASELLVPDQHLRKTISSGITDTSKLAKIYGVPVSSIRKRLNELQMIPGAVKVA